jgi:hypothetical protein
MSAVSQSRGRYGSDGLVLRERLEESLEEDFSDWEKDAAGSMTQFYRYPSSNVVRSLGARSKEMVFREDPRPVMG